MPTNSLKLIFEKKMNRVHHQTPNIFLLCVFRDEYLLLDYFIKYYKSLGVTHFIMIDNLSKDNSIEYLKQLKDINLKIYQANGSYKEARFGTAWINQLLKKHCNNQYCFTVDIDELFYFDQRQFDNLSDLIHAMESQDYNVVPVTLLDMYPEESNNHYKKSENFLKHSPFFDQYNTSYYKTFSTIYNNFTHKVGGMRKRVFNKTVCIHKLPFFKYNFSPIETAPGYHFFQENGEVITDSNHIRLFNRPAVLLHFKFLKPNLETFFKKRIELNQDWDDSSEYKSYAHVIQDRSAFKFYDKNYSIQMVNSESLEAFFY